MPYRFNPFTGNLDYYETGSGGTYTNATPTTETVGGVEAGSTFSSLTFQEVFDLLFYPYQEPTFSAFAISGQSTTLEVGDEVTGGSRTFTWTTTNSSNVDANTIAIKDVTGNPTPNTDLATGLADDSTESVDIGSAISKSTNTSHQWQIRGTDTEANEFTRNFTVNWRWRRYHGTDASTSLTEPEIEALANSSLTNAIATTYSFAGGDYKYICYPSSLGTLTTFTDVATSLNVPFEDVDVVSVTNSFGETTNYNVHRSTNVLGGAIDIAAS